MAIVEALNFEDSHRRFRRVNLLHTERTRDSNFETTLITGQNGSHKSTLLKQLVNSLVAPSEPDLLSHASRENLNPNSDPVFCISGSTADRFPQKELSAGRRSQFDVPHYTYVGQRVGNNLLSRKSPLETMLEFALNPQIAERYAWGFFSDAHVYAGIFPTATYRLAFRAGGSAQELHPLRSNLRAQLSNITPETDTAKYGKRPLPNVSHATAQWILSEFSPVDCDSLQELLKRFRRHDVTLTSKGALCEDAAPNTLRLGLLLGLLKLQDVQVRSLRHGVDFSALELSSGEYHMFSTILAAGFGLDEKSVLLIDEPENSLHPQWQRDLMGAILGACSQVMNKGHVIISTHSPLIVGSVTRGSTVVDMTGDEPQLSLVSYGASSDELLLSQFGVGSSRNKVVVDTVQHAVSLVERGDFENPEFLALRPQLRSIRNALTSTDPMVDILDALLSDVPVQ